MGPGSSVALTVQTFTFFPVAAMSGSAKIQNASAPSAVFWKYFSTYPVLVSTATEKVELRMSTARTFVIGTVFR